MLGICWTYVCVLTSVFFRILHTTHNTWQFICPWVVFLSWRCRRFLWTFMSISSVLQVVCSPICHNNFTFTGIYQALPSVLWRCWLGGRKGIRSVKTEWWGAGVVICLERGADLHMAQLMSLPLTISCFSKIQIGFTFLVPAHPGSPGQRAVKRVCVRQACVLRKPTWVSLIYRTEPTTKKCKTEKLKSNDGYAEK